MSNAFSSEATKNSSAVCPINAKIGFFCLGRRGLALISWIALAKNFLSLIPRHHKANPSIKTIFSTDLFFISMASRRLGSAA